MSITPTSESLNIWNVAEDTPVKYAVLGSVQIKETKTFQEQESEDIIIIDPRLADKEIDSVSNTTCTVTPSSLEIVNILNVWYVQFNATLGVTVKCTCGDMYLLQSVQQISGSLGAVGTVIPTNATIALPSVTCNPATINIDKKGVTGKMTIGEFNVEVLELKSVEVALNNLGSNIADPIIPIQE